MRRVGMGFAVFLGLMAVCTVISRSVYAYGLPMVSICQPESKYVEHKVEAEGLVAAGGENPVTYLPGLRIETMAVHVGDRVEEGDVLFSVDLKDLERLMEEKRSDIAEVSLRIDTMLENQAVAREKRELELARAREDYDITARIRDTQVGRAEENYVQAEQDFEEEGADENDGELKSALQSAAYEEADARAQRDEAVRQAKRRVEDILLPEEKSSELEGAEQERRALSAQLDAFRRIEEEQGVVRSSAPGVVTEILAGAGERIPDTAVLLLSDESLPCQLRVLLNKEQKKFVGLGEKVTVKTEGAKAVLEAKIDYLEESRSLPGQYEASVELPEGIGIPGMSGSISCTRRGEKYRLCIPLEALHTREERDYVFLLREREGILGAEYYVEEVNVTVADKNDHWAALEEGVVDQESRIILSSTGEIYKGDTVRSET